MYSIHKRRVYTKMYHKSNSESNRVAEIAITRVSISPASRVLATSRDFRFRSICHCDTIIGVRLSDGQIIVETRKDSDA